MSDQEAPGRKDKEEKREKDNKKGEDKMKEEEEQENYIENLTEDELLKNIQKLEEKEKKLIEKQANIEKKKVLFRERYQVVSGEADKKRIENERIQQQEIKRKEEEKRIQEQKKLEEQRKRKQEQKKRQQEKQKKIQEEIRRQEEELRRLKRVSDYKQHLLQLQTQIKRLQEEMVDPQVPKLSFEQLLGYITDQKQKWSRVQNTANEIFKKLNGLKAQGEGAGEKVPQQPQLSSLVIEISKKISFYNQLQSTTYEQQEENEKQKRREEILKSALPKESRSYIQNNFYELEINSLYLKSRQALEEQKEKNEKYEQDKRQVQTMFEILRIKQKHINEIKILIELLQLKPEQLEYNQFNLPTFQVLLAKKAVLIAEINQNNKPLANMQDFNKIEEELANVMRPLNTQGFMVPYRYPVHLLAKTKQNLVQEYYDQLIKSLKQNIEVEKRKIVDLEEKKRQSTEQIVLKKGQLEKAQEGHQQFIEKQEQSVKNSLFMSERQHEHQILPRELVQPPKEQPIVLLTNTEELAELYSQMNDQSQSKEANRLFRERRAQRLQLQKEFKELSEHFLRSPLNMEEYLAKTAIPNLSSESRSQQQRQFEELLRKCETIEQNKRREAQKLGRRNDSNIGLYSSILV